MDARTDAARRHADDRGRAPEGTIDLDDQRLSLTAPDRCSRELFLQRAVDEAGRLALVRIDPSDEIREVRRIDHRPLMRCPGRHDDHVAGTDLVRLAALVLPAP